MSASHLPGICSQGKAAGPDGQKRRSPKGRQQPAENEVSRENRKCCHLLSLVSVSLAFFFLSFLLWNTSMRENTYMYNPFMRVCCVFGASPNRRRNITSNELLSANREGQDTRAGVAFHETPLCICYNIMKKNNNNNNNTVLYFIPAGK